MKGKPLKQNIIIVKEFHEKKLVIDINLIAKCFGQLHQENGEKFIKILGFGMLQKSSMEWKR